MLVHTCPYGFGTVLSLPHAEAVERTKAALAREGFGVISEIDMAAVLRQRLGVDAQPYVILGACMPALAHRALRLDPNVGLLLPCNVAVYATDDAEPTTVAALDPGVALALARNPALAPLAAEVTAKLRRALAGVAADAASLAPAPIVEEVDEIC